MSGGHPAHRFNPLADSLRELDAAALAEVTRRAGYTAAERLVTPLTEACRVVLTGYLENARACERWNTPLSMTPPNPAPAEDAAREQWAVWQTTAERYSRQRATAATAIRDAVAALERFAAATASPATVSDAEPMTDEARGGSTLPAEQPTGGPALFVTIGRPWKPSEEGPRPTIDELRPHLDARQRELLDRVRQAGLHLHDLLVVAVEGCPPPAGWRPTNDAHVRACLYALVVCRDLVGREDRYTTEATRSLRIEADEWLCSCLPGEFLDTDPRFDILCHANTLRFRTDEDVDWLTVAARVRGILGAGQPLDDSAERQLGYVVSASGTDAHAGVVSSPATESAAKLPATDPTRAGAPRGKGQKGKTAKDQRKELLANLQQRVAELHRPGASREATAELAFKDDDARRWAKELGKEITAEFVHSCLNSKAGKRAVKRGAGD